MQMCSSFALRKVPNTVAKQWPSKNRAQANNVAIPGGATRLGRLNTQGPSTNIDRSKQEGREGGLLGK
eukprot:6462556-Amphidinium_carterae.1